jgi:hypothetical protein
MGSTTDYLGIGGRQDGFNFNGQLDEVEIFDRALTQAEIQSIVAADSFGKCKQNAARRTPFDFDGDGKTDVSFWKPTSHNWLTSEGNWYILQSQTNTVRLTNFARGADDVQAPSTYVP